MNDVFLQNTGDVEYSDIHFLYQEGLDALHSYESKCRPLLFDQSQGWLLRSWQKSAYCLS